MSGLLKKILTDIRIMIDFGNPGFDLNYPGSGFQGFPGYFRFGFNPGIIPTNIPTFSGVTLLF